MWIQLQAALKLPAVGVHRGPLVHAGETGKEVLEAAAEDLVGGNATKAEDDLAHPPNHAFLGPSGAVEVVYVGVTKADSNLQKSNGPESGSRRTNACGIPITTRATRRAA
jgi:hypothetical protein